MNFWIVTCSFGRNLEYFYDFLQKRIFYNNLLKVGGFTGVDFEGEKVISLARIEQKFNPPTRGYA